MLAIRRYWAGPLYRTVVDQAEEVLRQEPDTGVAGLERAMSTSAAYQVFGWLEQHLQQEKYCGPRGLLQAARRQSGAITAELDRTASLHAERLVLDPDIELPGYYQETDFHLVPGGIHSRDYDGVVYEWAAGSTTMMSNENVSVHDALAVHIAGLRPARVLDVGCGFGRTLDALAPLLPDAWLAGCDLSAPALRVAHHHAVTRVRPAHLHQARAEDLGPYPDASFDVVTATMLIHEMPQAAVLAFLRAARRVLRPGGRLAILDFYRIPGQTLGLFFHLGHARRNGEPYMPDLLGLDLEKELRGAGFGESSITPFPDGAATHQLPSRWRLPWTLIEAVAGRTDGAGPTDDV